MKIALGISGCIAAYKAAELVRRLQQERMEVQVILTRSAQEFITPLTFAAITGQKVITEMFGDTARLANVESAIEHIAVAQSIDALVIAPATANLLGKLAHGIADDFLTTLYLATKAPVIVAPAMNVNMWEHAAVQENLRALAARGVHVVEPDEGYLACGMTGPGRLASGEAIAARVSAVLGIKHDFQGETVLVTAGPTIEDIDPIRFISNRSSGRMGYAVAEAARRRGAKVILVSGPTHLAPPPDVEFISVRSSEEMQRAVLGCLERASVVIKAAAVADYRPSARQKQKMKRGAEKFSLELELTADIVAEVGKKKGKQTIVGFAAETENLLGNARKKLVEKRLDLIVANDVTQDGAGFDNETNIVTLLARDHRQTELSKSGKFEIANRILDEVLRLRNGA